MKPAGWQSPPPPQRKSLYRRTGSRLRPAQRAGFQFHSVRAPLHIPHSCLGETPVVSRSERLDAASLPEIHLRKSQSADSPSTLSSQLREPTSFRSPIPPPPPARPYRLRTQTWCLVAR